MTKEDTKNSEALEDNHIEKWRTKSRRSKLDRQTGTINALQERKYPESIETSAKGKLVSNLWNQNPERVITKKLKCKETSKRKTESQERKIQHQNK